MSGTPENSSPDVINFQQQQHAHGVPIPSEQIPEGDAVSLLSVDPIAEEMRQPSAQFRKTPIEQLPLAGQVRNHAPDSLEEVRRIDAESSVLLDQAEEDITVESAEAADAIIADNHVAGMDADRPDPTLERYVQAYIRTHGHEPPAEFYENFGK